MRHASRNRWFVIGALGTLLVLGSALAIVVVGPIQPAAHTGDGGHADGPRQRSDDGGLYVDGDPGASGDRDGNRDTSGADGNRTADASGASGHERGDGVDGSTRGSGPKGAESDADGGRVVVHVDDGNDDDRVRVPGGVDSLVRGRDRARHDRSGDRGEGRQFGVDGETDANATDTDETEAIEPTTGSLVGRVIEVDPEGIATGIASVTVAVHTSTNADTPPIEAPTAVDGSYRAGDLPPGAVRVALAQSADTGEERVALRYFSPAEQYGVIVEGEVTTIDLVVTRRADLVGEVIGENGSPLAGAAVQLEPSGGWGTSGGSTTVTTDDYGLFSSQALQADAYRVTVSAQGYVPRVLELVRPRDYGPTNRLIIDLAVDTRVRGTVFDDTGAPLHGARVSAHHYVEGGRRQTSVVYTEVDGTYALPVDGSSVNVIRAERPGFARQEKDGILPGREGVDFTLVPNGRGALAVKVLEPGGLPAVRVRVNGAEIDLDSGTLWREADPGEVTLTIISTATHASAIVTGTVIAGELTDLGIVTLITPAPVDVVVLDDTATSINTAQVRLLESGEIAAAPTTPFNGYYYYTLQSAPFERAFVIEVSHPTYPTQTVNVPATERSDPIVVNLAAGAYSARVLVQTVDTNLIAGATVERLSGGSAVGSATTDETGTALLIDLPSATIQVRVSAPGYVPQTLNAQAAVVGDPVTEAPVTIVTLAVAGGIWGEVTAAGGPLDPARVPTFTAEIVGVGTWTTQPVRIAVPEQPDVWRYEFTSLPIGQVHIYNTDLGVFPTVTLQTVEGQTLRHDLAIPGATHLRARFVRDAGAPFGSATAYLYHRDRWDYMRPAYTDGQGWCEFDYVAPGPYAIAFIHNGSSDQRMYEVDVPDFGGVGVYQTTITVPTGAHEVRGRVLVEDESTPYTETATVRQGGTQETSFELQIRHPDDVTVTSVTISGGPFTNAAGCAVALEQDATFTGLGLTASANGADLVIGTGGGWTGSMPYFSVLPVDAGAHDLFGHDPFRSSHLATGTKVALERISASMQELLAAYLSVDALGYYTFVQLVAGQYRPRVVPHYTGANYAMAFGRTVDAGTGGSPFVTIWTATGAEVVNLTGALQLVGDGIIRNAGTGAYWIVYVDDLNAPPTQYPPSLGPRGVTQRSGYYFGGSNGDAVTGNWSTPRLRRGHTYRIEIHANGFQTVVIEVTVPPTATGTVTAPAMQLVRR